LFSETKNSGAIVLTAIFFAFFCSHAPAFANTNKQNSDVDANLQKFEQRLWSGTHLSAKEFDSICSQLNSALATEINRPQRATFSEKSLNYLEKLKTFRTIKLFYQTDLFQQRLKKHRDFLAQTYQLAADWFDLIKRGPELQPVEYNNLTKKAQRSFTAAVDSAKKIDPLLVNFLVWQKPVTARQLQQNLNSRELILDYWLHNDSLAAFFVSADSVGVRSWQIEPGQFTDALQAFDSTLFDQKDVLDLKFDAESAYYLYRLLIRPLKAELFERSRLVIIPDSPFLNLPFECLISQPADSTKQTEVLYKEYRFMKFLIKKFSISYNLSLSALDPELQNMRDQTKLGRRLLTMSEPDFPVENDSLGNALPPLLWLDHSPYVNDEIRRVSRLLFRHDNVRGNEVTMDYLKQRAADYRWIYLAQLGLLNNKQPLQSGLMISASQNGSADEDYWLTVNDVFQIPFRADMVTLSATIFYPKVVKNARPGIVALPQAFLLAGNKSVLYSLWHVHSISTSEFMSKFYWELKYKRQHNTVALRGAKLASMRDTFDFLDQKISRAHPYFWAGFRLIGSPYVSSPSNAKIPPWGVVIIVYVALLIVGGIITRKTLAKK